MLNKASRKLKNGKSPGKDNMSSELIKHSPLITHKMIADILTKSVETENYLLILKEGILTPLQKPPKRLKKGEKRTNNLRPVILLPTIRKLLAICVIERTWEKMKHYIPKDQAAYQKGRSATEQVMSMKLLIEKAITSQGLPSYNSNGRHV